MANPLSNKERFDWLEKAIRDLAEMHDHTVAGKRIAQEFYERFKSPSEPSPHDQWYAATYPDGFLDRSTSHRSASARSWNAALRRAVRGEQKVGDLGMMDTLHRIREIMEHCDG